MTYHDERGEQKKKDTKDMKVTKKEALAFFAALGFTKATTWRPSKLKEKLALVPAKVKREQVPEGHEEFYENLCKAGDDIELVVEEKKASAGEDAEPSKKKSSKKKTTSKAPKAPKTTKSAKTVERDSYGCRKGSIAGKVNAVVSGDWQTEQDIAKSAGVTLDQARGRLYYAAQEGAGQVMEHRRLVQYRFKPKK